MMVNQKQTLLRSGLMGLAVMGAALVAASCTPVAVETVPAIDQTPPALVDASTSYLKELGEKRLASTWDAMRMTYQLTGEKETPRSMVQAAEYLKAQGIVPAGWNTQENGALHTGELALLVCNTLEIKGGAMRHVLPGTERYAVLELRYLNIMQDTVTNRYVTGADLITVIRRASEFQKKGVIE
jgi:hypothetical protein